MKTRVHKKADLVPSEGAEFPRIRKEFRHRSAFVCRDPATGGKFVCRICNVRLLSEAQTREHFRGPFHLRN